MRIEFGTTYRHSPIEELSKNEKLRRTCEKVFENPRMYNFSGGFFIDENGRVFDYGSTAPIFMARLRTNYLVERSFAYDPRNIESEVI